MENSGILYIGSRRVNKSFFADSMQFSIDLLIEKIQVNFNGAFLLPDVQTFPDLVMLQERPINDGPVNVYLKSKVMVNDTELEKRVHEELSKEPLLARNEIVVEADDGVVTLSGIVETEDLRGRAKTIAEHVPEVVSVVELLDIKPPLPSEEDMTKSTFGQEENIIADTAEKKLKISGA